MFLTLVLLVVMLWAAADLLSGRSTGFFKFLDIVIIAAGILVFLN